MTQNLMQGKKGLVMGVANNKSIAWKIAQQMHKQGAELAFTYQNEQVAKKVIPLFDELGAEFYEELDVLDDQQFTQVFNKLNDYFNGELDFLVHAIAGGPNKDELQGKYVATSREGFIKAMEVSVYSFTKALQLAQPLMKGRDSSAITLSYYGSEKVMPNYNVMGVAKAALESSVAYLADDFGEEGIRVNALSPGPVLTRAACGISDFRGLLKAFSERAPMKRLVKGEEIAKSALYLLSDLSQGVTGEIIHVDGGYNIIG
ncbi:enoyl-ACP reductase [Natroniella sulfidigena]|uniref:enoyl-ACP reductase FabI n=1 Tax=Natroniella sulfidigena TaxID=723921 RepID=UPI00200B7B69|nr:enoyl-ACP reductase [Natroniella sulfidigena]MCK8816804.1 enoyl-ACP reductase [Natroniella sulfidigena]